MALRAQNPFSDGGLHPGAKLGEDGRQVDEQVLRLPDHRGGGADAAPRVDQLDGIQELPAVLALVPARVRVMAVGAGAQDVPVGEEPLVLLAEGLAQDALVDVPVLVELREDVLRDLGMHRHGGPAEPVECDGEPFVDVAVDGVVAVAQLPRRDPLLQRPGLGGGAVLVGPAHVQGLVAGQPAVARKHVGGEHLDEVAQVRDVVHVRQRGGDQTSFHRCRKCSGGAPGRQGKGRPRGTARQRLPLYVLHASPCYSCRAMETL